MDWASPSFPPHKAGSRITAWFSVSQIQWRLETYRYLIQQGSLIGDFHFFGSELYLWLTFGVTSITKMYH